MQAAKMKFLRIIKGVTIFDERRNTAILESLDIESLLLRIERFQLSWFGQASRVPHEQLPKQTLYTETSEKRQLEDSEQDSLIVSRILAGTVWDFIQVKCKGQSKFWWIEKCDG